MHPVLFVIPLPFSDTKILIYSVFFSITVSLVLGIYLGTRAAQQQALPVETALNMTFFGLIALILGARLYAFFENPSFYFTHPLRLIKLWEGSLATYGGAIGGVLGCLLYLALKKQKVFPFLDAYAPYGFLGIAIIRFGDFLNGTAFGKRTDLFWGVCYPKDSFAYNHHRNHGWISPDKMESLAVHPSQLFETVACLLIFGFLLWRNRRGKKFQGEIFLLGGILYSGARFMIDYCRDDLRTHLPLHLASTQWVGIFVFLTLAVTYLYLNTRHKTFDAAP
jgi:phosphatidylglycerol---prolipoprotein diacylglyceryl transferase